MNRTVHTAFNASLERSRPFIPHDIIADYERVALSDPNSVHALDTRHGHYVCAGPPSSYKARSLARVIPLRDYIQYHTALPITPAALAEARERLADDHGRRALARGHHNVMRGKRDLAWLTTSIELGLALRGDPGAIANTARAVLGLCHIGSGNYLVRINLPPNWTPGEVHVPTFIDGAGHDAFCVWTSHTACGYTWNLLVNDMGIPELVCRQRQMTDDCIAELLGETTGDPNAIDFVAITTRRP